MKTLTEITEILENMNDDELFTLWNDYCANNSMSDNEVYEFDDDFFETYFEGRPAEAARALFFGDVKNWNDAYITFNGYGNLKSSNYITDLISVGDLAGYIEDHQEDFEDILQEDEA